MLVRLNVGEQIIVELFSMVRVMEKGLKGDAGFQDGRRIYSSFKITHNPVTEPNVPLTFTKIYQL
jgi:hypothetical protein